MKKICLFLIIFLGFNLHAAYAETVALSTYYPAPFGVYDRLRLVPKAGPLPLPCQIGTLSVETPDIFRFCMDDGLGVGEWGFLKTGGVWTQNDIDAGNADIFPTETVRDINVGIGTITPGFELDVVGDGGVSEIITLFTNNGTEVRIVPNLGAGAMTGVSDAGDQGIISDAGGLDSGSLVLAPWNSNGAGIDIESNSNIQFNADDDLFILGATGRVGLGTNAPADRLDLSDNTGNIRLYDGNGTPHILGDGSAGVDGIIVRTTANPVAGQPVFSVRSSVAADLLRVEFNGAVKTVNHIEVDGAGDSYVSSQLRVGDNAAAAYDLDVAGTIGIDKGGNSGELMVGYTGGNYYAVYAP